MLKFAAFAAGKPHHKTRTTHKEKTLEPRSLGGGFPSSGFRELGIAWVLFCLRGRCLSMVLHGVPFGPVWSLSGGAKNSRGTMPTRTPNRRVMGLGAVHEDHKSVSEPEELSLARFQLKLLWRMHHVCLKWPHFVPVPFFFFFFVFFLLSGLHRSCCSCLKLRALHAWKSRDLAVA